MSTATATKPTKTPNKRPATIEEATMAMTALEIEAEQLPQQIQAAATEGDAARLIALRSRVDEMPTAKKAARAVLLQHRIPILEAEIVLARRDSERLNEERQAAEDALELARNAYQMALAMAGNVASDIQFSTADLSTARRELAELMAELSSPPAPVVRAKNIFGDSQKSWG
jgi:predicted  nucleic acid-binding Zn-ribbon protein